MYEHIDLSKIPVFLTVAEHMSFTEAAYQLYSTQSSVSKAISAFESSLGFPLFIRQNRKISLTKEGSFLYTRLSNADADIQDSLNEARIFHEGGLGIVSIGTSGYNPKAWEFEKVCSMFHIEHPSEEIELRYMSYPTIKRALTDKRVDAILINDRDCSLLSGYHMIPLFTGGPVFACNRFGNTDLNPENFSLDDYAKKPFISINPNIIPSYHDYLIAVCQAYGFTPKIKKYVSTLQEIVLYIGSSNMVTIMDRAIFPMKNSDLNILPIPLKGNMYPLRSVIIWNPDNENPTLQSFIQLACKTLNTVEEIL